MNEWEGKSSLISLFHLLFYYLFPIFLIIIVGLLDLFCIFFAFLSRCWYVHGHLLRHQAVKQ